MLTQIQEIDPSALINQGRVCRPNGFARVLILAIKKKGKKKSIKVWVYSRGDSVFFFFSPFLSKLDLEKNRDPVLPLRNNWPRSNSAGDENFPRKNQTGLTISSIFTISCCFFLSLLKEIKSDFIENGIETAFLLVF